MLLFKQRLGVEKIISGGQTGVDRAALDVALEFEFPCGGWCPKGRWAEDGRLPARYPLWETNSTNYASRTRRNVRESDGTLILTIGEPTGGTLMTAQYARKQRKPFLIADLQQFPQVADAIEWLQSEQIRILNIAGPRASQQPKIYPLARHFLQELLITTR